MFDSAFILGGYQTDFAENWAREGHEIFDRFKSTIEHALLTAKIVPEVIQIAHVGNFAAELFCGQGHSGGFFAAAHPVFSDIPASRHEGACASGSLAALAAAANIESGRYDFAAVVGIEQMRNVSGHEAAKNIGGPAMWNGHECAGVKYPWPRLFGKLGDEYDKRYGLKQEHLAGIAKLNFANAKRNGNAQTRRWEFNEDSFAEHDEANRIIDGRIPVNPSGGLIGLGHPVGTTGVRMLLDCHKQVTNNAGGYQVDGAKDFATLNIGGSVTTSVSFIVGTG